MGGKSKEIIRKILFFIALTIFIWSCFKLFNIFNEYRKNAKSYDEIEQFAPQVDIEGAGGEGQMVKPYEFKAEDYEKLYAINNEFKGWLMIPNTKVNYPVAQGKDNEFYLTHNFKKESNAGGGIFISSDNKNPFEDKNTIIHGHYMKDKSMFGSLHSFKDSNFAKENNKFYVTTKEGVLEYEIFSIYIEKANTEPYRYSFASDEQYVEFLNGLRSKSNVDMGVANLTKDDKIVTLSTCSYEKEDYRLLIHGRLVK